MIGEVPRLFTGGEQVSGGSSFGVRLSCSREGVLIGCGTALGREWFHACSRGGNRFVLVRHLSTCGGRWEFSRLSRLLTC